MIIPLPPMNESKQDVKLEEERNVFDETQIYEVESSFMMDPTTGLQLADDEYIIDPAFQEMLGIENFEDLIKKRR